VSTTSGESLPERLGKERKRSLNIRVIAVILVAVLIVGAVAWLMVRFVSHPSEYTARGWIYINGNGGFTHVNGVIGGRGTASNPYIIADWDINASTGGIYINGTDAHFIVRNCLVHDGIGYGGALCSGIHLSNCVNGTLENNICSNDWYGIDLAISNNITLVNNICRSNNQTGIDLWSSSNNTLTNNNCSSNINGDGICLRSSSNNNELSWNQVSNNGGDGVDISSSSNNHIYHNIIFGNNGATGTYNVSHAQARDDGTNNLWWNSTDGHGNYWSDWTTPDADLDGIVDQPYNIVGITGAKDYYPLTAPP